MTSSRGARSGRLVRSATAVAALTLALPGVARAADTYIVQLKDEPLASYTGGQQGIPATSPKVTGNKLKADSAPGFRRDMEATLGNPHARRHPARGVCGNT